MARCFRLICRVFQKHGYSVDDIKCCNPDCNVTFATHGAMLQIGHGKDPHLGNEPGNKEYTFSHLLQDGTVEQRAAMIMEADSKDVDFICGTCNILAPDTLRGAAARKFVADTDKLGTTDAAIDQ